MGTEDQVGARCRGLHRDGGPSRSSGIRSHPDFNRLTTYRANREALPQMVQLHHPVIAYKKWWPPFKYA